MFSCCFALAQKAGNEHMIPAHMDTMNAAPPLTDSVTTMLNTIAIVLCLLLPALEAVQLVEVLRPLTPILTLEFETLSLLLTLHGVTCTEMTEGGVLIKLTITVEADHLIPLSPDIPPHNGPQDKTPNPHIHLKELPCPLEEVKGPVLAAGLQAPILLAALAAQGVEGVFSHSSFFFKLLICVFFFFC